MNDFRNYLQEISYSSKVPFNIVNTSGTVLYNCGLDFDKSESIDFPVIIDNSRVIVTINKKNESCINLLRYILEREYEQIGLKRENLLKDIIEGKEVAMDKIHSNFPQLNEGYILFYISVEGSRYEAVNIINQLYDNNVFVSLYGDSIIIVGTFQDVEDHAISIKDSIVSDLYCNCYVSYGEPFYDIDSIKKAYEAAKESKVLLKKFGMKEEILNYDNILFEKMVFNLNSNLKEALFATFRENFDKFDNEIIQTINKFFDCDLNISNTAKKLYIHRNTLIYRLDKIKKETGFDIRNFKEATIFITAFLIWKEMS
ncbi:PucR family transcriptional regulator [Clostridium grantii]|uniref:PucR C-terminal helix-turn-helix domain-containing protein n=1 Tax=Clostridium grantii DSM 8605 TaxID=1121316 RepID=A0A1M5X8N0_9CLOT|nr:helix-turn-helix domain-containing protein [Clostridium grantii]SHH96126.1 PucR C-terminal helix-turn-helix domain-containing protein [Clostridium grantii DSM 8605]